MESIAHALRQFIKENLLFGGKDDFADEDSFLELGLIDSTGVLELVSYLESEYQVTVGDDELAPENLDSINNLVRFIQSKRSVSSASA